MQPDDLVCYCGVHGTTCASWRENLTFREVASLLLRWCDAQGFPHWMPDTVKEFNFGEFRKGLEFFSNNGSWLVCQKCCRDGGGNPECEIRKCCRGRNLTICFECNDYPCVKTNRPEIRERGEEYRRLGRQKWIEEQMKKAGRGFEHHLKKYVSIEETERPTENAEPNQRSEGARRSRRSGR